MQCLERAIQPVQLQLRLRICRFSRVQSDASESRIVLSPQVVAVLLTELVAYCDLGGVDGEDYWSLRAVIDGAQRRRMQQSVLQFVHRLFLRRSPFERYVLAQKAIQRVRLLRVVLDEDSRDFFKVSSTLQATNKEARAASV